MSEKARLEVTPISCWAKTPEVETSRLPRKSQTTRGLPRGLDSLVFSCPDGCRERGAHMRTSRMTGQSAATSPVIGALWRRAHRAYGHLCLLADLAPQADGILGPVKDHQGWRKAPGEWQRGYVAAEQHGRGYMESPMSNARGGQNRRSAPVDDGNLY